jgi:hypothetical protein
MKIVKEHIILEKFTEDSDPIHDMGIGTKYLIQKWLDYYNHQKLSIPSLKYKSSFLWKSKINDDLTIDILGSIDLNSVGLKKLPSYIKFNIIYGSFHINWNNFVNMKNFPKEIKGDFYVNGNPIVSLEGCPKIVTNSFDISECCTFTEKDILNVCKTKDIHFVPDLSYDVFRKKDDYYKEHRIGELPYEF